MKHVHKILALLLALVMVMGMISGCASNNEPAANTTAAGNNTPADNAGDATEGAQPQETVTIKWHRTAWRSNPDTDKVADAINAYIEPLIGVKVEIVDDSNYNLSMELAAGGDVDLFWSASWGGAYDFINSGAAMDLAGLLDSYPTLKDSIPDNVWEAATWGEHNWYVPILKEAGTGIQIDIPAEIYQKYCPDLKSISNLSDLTPYLEKMKADGITSAFDTTNFEFRDCVSPCYFQKVNDYVGVDKDMKAIAFVNTPEYMEFVNTMYSWQKAGYIPAEQFEQHTVDYQKELIAAGNMGFSTWSATPDGEANASARFGVDMKLIDFTPIYMTTDSPAGSLYMINASSTKADACLKFLGLLYTDPVVANLAAYGIEGEHYDIVDGRIQLRDESGYKYPGVWIVTNVNAPDLQVGESEDKKQQYNDFNATCDVSPICGFVFDKTNVEAELAAMDAVRAEYVILLERGFYDPDVYVAKYQSALQAAGLDKVVAEVQSQLDAFLAGK